MPSSHRGDPWFSVGLASSFPDLTESGRMILADEAPNNDCPPSESNMQRQHGYKVFLAPEKEDRSGQATQLSDDPKDQLDASLRKGDQVLVFRYKGKFHAIDNVRSILAFLRSVLFMKVSYRD